jgi:hypothetical protein
MRGFLRRTLESAKGAEQRLRPLTGSVYAGNRRRQEFQPGSWGEENINVPTAPGAVPQSREFSQPGVSQITSASAPSPLLPVTPDPSQSATGSHHKSERPSSAGDSFIASSAAPPNPENPTRSHGDASQTPFPLLPLLRPGNPPLLSGSQRNEGLRAEAPVPQSPQGNSRAEKNQQEGPRPAPAPQQKVEPLLRPAMAARPPAAGPQLSAQRNRPPQEPEIQVHIGRIEVIAAAPQPPRMPSPRPNRATSLADYLAGRNGRS